MSVYMLDHVVIRDGKVLSCELNGQELVARPTVLEECGGLAPHEKCRCGQRATEHLTYRSDAFTIVEFHQCASCWTRTQRMLIFLADPREPRAVGSLVRAAVEPTTEDGGKTIRLGGVVYDRRDS